MVYYIFQTFENIVATFVCSASNGHYENFSIETPWHNADIQDPIVVSLFSAAHMPAGLRSCIVLFTDNFINDNQ